MTKRGGRRGEGDERRGMAEEDEGITKLKTKVISAAVETSKQTNKCSVS